MSPKRAAAAKPVASLPHSGNIAQFELRNGIRVLAYENFTSPAVVVNGYFHAGARDEVPFAGRSKLGLAGFVSDCLMRGTERYTYEEIFERSESIGASVGVSSAMHTTSFFAKSLAEDLPLMCDLLSQSIRYPTFPEAEVEKERAEWLSDLEERANNTQAMSGRAFGAMCYPPGHPYRDPADGEPETARAITLDDVRAFHRTHYSPQGMCVVVVGAVKAGEARDRVEAAFGDWQGTRPARTDLPPAPKPQGMLREHVSMPGKSQTTLLWGQPALPRTHPDWMACSLMNSILGQFGMYGRLGESVRKEEGLVYYIGTRFDGGPGPGAWSCYAGTNPSTVERVLEISRAEVRRIQSRRVKPSELEDNQRYFTGSLPLALETNEGVAGQIVNSLRYDLGLDYLLEYPQRVHAVTADDVRRVAQTWLDPDNFVMATAGP